MKKKIILRIFLIILILLWMWLVFGLSSDNAEESSSLSLKIAKLFTKDKSALKILEPFIRKLAHLTEYMARWIFILWFVFNF